jgi:hypothetical protein
MNIKSIAASILMIAGLLGSAQASLLDGQDVRYTYYRYLGVADSNADNGIKTVGNGIELPSILDSVAQLDISDTNILITFLPVPPDEALFVDNSGTIFFDATNGFSGFEIFDVFGLIDAFTSVRINPISNLLGFNDSLITFDADHIWINWQGLYFDRNSTVLSLEINGNSQPIPEPGTLLLMGISIFAFAWRRQTKRL